MIFSSFEDDLITPSAGWDQEAMLREVGARPFCLAPYPGTSAAYARVWRLIFRARVESARRNGAPTSQGRRHRDKRRCSLICATDESPSHPFSGRCQAWHFRPFWGRRRKDGFSERLHSLLERYFKQDVDSRASA